MSSRRSDGSACIVYFGRILGLVVATVSLQVVLQIFLVKSEAPEIVRIANEAVKKRSDVILFGDSVLTAVSPTDKDKLTLGEKVASGLLPELSMTAVGGPSFAGEMFLEFGRFFSRSGYRPSRVVVPINLRSFSTAFDTRPEWQNVRKRTELYLGSYPVFAALTLPFLIFKGVSLAPISKREWLAEKVLDGDRVVGMVRDYASEDALPTDETELGRKFIWYYMANLSPEHAKIKALTKVVENQNRALTRTLFYVLPIDMETGRQLIGDRFREQVSRNTRVVCEAIRRTGAEFLDLSSSVGADGFMWRQERVVSEHLNQIGREQTAKKLVSYLKSEPGSALRSVASNCH